MAAGKHAIERVVIRYRDGVVLVIVAAGATDSQPHHTAGHHVDSVVYDVVRIVQKTPPQREEPHRGKRFLVGAQFQLVGSELLDDKPVVRQVSVEGVNDVIAISVRVSEEPRLVPGEVTLGVSVTRHIKPVTPPALAKTRRGQHPLDEPPIRSRRAGGHEGIHLPGRRREAGQVEGHPANQRPATGAPGRLHAIFEELGQDKMIHRAAWPSGPGHSRHAWPCHRLKCPVTGCLRPNSGERTGQRERNSSEA